jgi:hypothetical protein
MRPIQCTAAVALTLALSVAAGCSDDPEPAPSSQRTDPASVPGPEDSLAPPPDSGGGGTVPIRLPSAPVGGGRVDDGGPELQCLSVAWLAQGAPVPDAGSVSLGSFTFEPAIFEVAAEGCESYGVHCSGFAFTSSAIECVLPVRWTGSPPDPLSESAEAQVDATANCGDGSEECATFLAALAGQPGCDLSLDLPPTDPAPTPST